MISIMDQLLRKLITIHVLCKHSHDQEEVPFQQMKTQTCEISQSIGQSSQDRFKEGFVWYKSPAYVLKKNHCGVICVVNSMLRFMPPCVLLSTPFVLQNKMLSADQIKWQVNVCY